MSQKLILASGSPQRRAILEQLGVPFEVIVSNATELEAGPPAEVVLENAFRKADAVARGLEGTPTVLGVDTVVTIGGAVYGKPRDAAHARETLELLNGASHRVLSGICVIDGAPDAPRARTAAAVTTVNFRRVDERTLSWYVGTGEWQDRAGGYAIQGRGAALVAGIEGDYLNVVGLPVSTLLELLPDLLH